MAVSSAFWFSGNRAGLTGQAIRTLFLSAPNTSAARVVGAGGDSVFRLRLSRYRGAIRIAPSRRTSSPLK